MTAGSANVKIGLSLLAITIATAALLFLVIPRISSRWTGLYNQDLFPDGYDRLAANLVEGNGYRFYPDTARTLMREPGYPLLLAATFRVFGETLSPVKVMNMFFALATAVLVVGMARRVSSSEAVALWSALLFLGHPAVIIAQSRGGVEAAFGFLLALFAVTLFRGLESGRAWDYVLIGAVLGITVLVRSTLLAFPFFLLVYLIARDRRGSLAIVRNIALMALTMCLVLSPWIVRNFALTRKVVPAASVLGVSAQAGQYICTHLTLERRWSELDTEAARVRERIAQEHGYRFRQGYYQTFYSSSDEIRFSNELLGRVVDEYEKSPGLLAKCMASNVLNLWFAGKTWRSTVLNAVVQVPYILLGILGTIWSARTGRFSTISPLVLVIVYVTAVHMPILAQARYSVPLIPFVSILAAVGLIEAGGKFWRAAGVVTHASDTGVTERREAARLPDLDPRRST